MVAHRPLVNNPQPPLCFVGVDPGIGGGIAVLDWSGKVVWVKNMPDTPSKMIAAFRHTPRPAIVLVEFVHSRPLQSAPSTFTFGRVFGRIETALAAAKLSYEFITSRVWQTSMECLTGGDKNVSKRRAQELFGAEVKVTHAVADALLLAECCRRLAVWRHDKASRALR